MTESEAIESLTNDFLSDGEEEVVEPVAEVVEAEPAAEAPQDLAAILEAQLRPIRDELEALKAPKQTEKQPNTEEQEIIAQMQQQLGLTQMKQQQEALQQQLAQEQKEKEFVRAWGAFEKAHPNVSQDDLVKYAKDNELNAFLGNPKGWETIYKGMSIQAKAKDKPDNITPSGSSTAKGSAFERMRKGEKVSDIELGEEILGL
jgi:hypothetical protein